MSILIFTGPSCCACNAWSKIGLLHQAVMFQFLNTGHAVLTSANPEIHKIKQCLCSPYCGGYLCHFAEYFCFPSASNCSRGHSIALCAAVGVIFGWVYVYFQYLYEKRQTQICLWDTLGLAAVMWCSGHLNQACGGTENRSVLPCGQDPSEPPEKLAAEAILFYAACCWWRPSLHNICTYICIYIYIYNR